MKAENNYKILSLGTLSWSNKLIYTFKASHTYGLEKQWQAAQASGPFSHTAALEEAPGFIRLSSIAVATWGGNHKIEDLSLCVSPSPRKFASQITTKQKTNKNKKQISLKILFQRVHQNIVESQN